VTGVAALFIDPKGPYPPVLGADACWDITRDARKYAGPDPVVAHPPCQLWGSFAHVNYKRWGGEHNRPGNDGGCFASALASVRRWGGVLEHPAFSKAWSFYGLVRPSDGCWTQTGRQDERGFGEWVCEVWQSAYGHKANKRTWLLYAGAVEPKDPSWERPIGSHQCGFHDQRGKDANKPTLGKRAASATPPAFRDMLLDLARRARPSVQARKSG
jgi:hypothetical protein